MTIPRKHHVGVLIGSLRRGSISRKMAKALIARAPACLECDIIEIGALPLYNEDLEADAPTQWLAFREAVRRCDALLFVTPEYNRSMPGCLKNATDVGSRPEGKGIFDGLPAAVVGVSPYATGAFGANHALRQNFVYLDLSVMQQPEAYIGGAGEVMSSHGAITDPKTEASLVAFMAAFSEWIELTQRPRERFDAFMIRREKASTAYINGDAKPLLAISANERVATFFPPNGKCIEGVSRINAANETGSEAFGKGSVGRFEIMQSGSAGGLGFWTGVQHASVRMRGKDEPIEMRLRTTEIFRIERGEWVLVHRHADMIENG